MKNISAVSTPENIHGNGNDKLTSAIAKVSLHDHLCLLYSNQEEQFASAIPFIRIGLENNEKCVYIADENTAEMVFDAMRAGGIDVDAALNKGSLTITSKRETYLKNGYFDPDEMIQFLADSTLQAKKEGYLGLRATGEMSWMFGGEPGTERLIEYEARLNNFLQTHDALALCQYNRTRFSKAILSGAIRTHPIVIVDNKLCDNFYFIPLRDFVETNIDSPEQVDQLIKNLVEEERAITELTHTALPL